MELYPEDRDWQTYTILPRDPQRVIISNSVSEIPYTSPLQEADRIVKFTVTGYPDTELHLKLIDPPDTAAYAPDGGWDLTGRTKNLPYEGNDNADDPANPDVGLALSPSPTSWEKEINVTPGTNWTATVYLKVTNRYAGDNYQVEVMKCVPSGCGVSPFPGALTQRIVALSPIFTAWKRIFIERDMMFRKGGVLADDYVPQPGCGTAGNPICDCIADPTANCCHGIGPVLCNQAVAYEWQNAVPGDQVAVFDELLTFSTAPEPSTVTAVGDPDASGLIVVTLDQGLHFTHLRSSQTQTTPFQPTFANHKSAGYGVVSGCDLAANEINSLSSCFHQADLRGVEAAYNDAFVEVFALRRGMSALPLLGPPFFDAHEMASGGTCDNPIIQFRDPYDFTPWVDFSKTWFRGRADANYFWLGGLGTTAPLKDGTVTCSVCGGANPRPQSGGDTFYWPSRATYVFAGAYEAFCPTAAQKATAIQGCTTHELAHQFFVNKGSTTSGHDDRCQWTALGAVSCSTPPSTCASVTEACLMNVAHDQWSSEPRLDRFDLFCGDPACPKGSTLGCCISCSVKGNGSIRQLQDPLLGGQ